jgi:hypothetical protein
MYFLGQYFFEYTTDVLKISFYDAVFSTINNTKFIECMFIQNVSFLRKIIL